MKSGGVMLKNKYSLITVLMVLTCFLYSSPPPPAWSELVINETNMPNKGNDFTVKAYEFMQNGEYRNFVTHEGVADKTAFLEGGVLVVDNRTYFAPEYIPTNVEQIEKYDVIRAYTLFNVVYYIEKIDQDIRSILADVAVPQAMETVQATILTCVYHKKIIERESFTMYIYGNDQLATSFNFYKGQPVGSTILDDITFGNSLPETPPTVMVIGKDLDNISEVLDYCKQNDILTITNHAKLLKDGVTVGVGTYSGALKILLNTNGIGGSSGNWNSENIFYKKI